MIAARSAIPSSNREREHTPHLRRVPGGAFCIWHSTKSDASRVDCYLTSDGSGMEAVRSTGRDLHRPARHGARAAGHATPLLGKRPLSSPCRLWGTPLGL